MILPDFPTFVPIALEHQAEITRRIAGFPPYSDHTFAGLWCWNPERSQAAAAPALSLLHGNLVISLADYFTHAPGLTFHGQSNIAETLACLFEYLAQNPHYTSWLRLIPQHNLQAQPLPDGYVLTEDRDNFDYIYDTAELAAMRGSKNQAHRNFCNRFVKQYRWHARCLDLQSSADADAVKSVLSIWAGNKNGVGIAADMDINVLHNLTMALDRIPILVVGIYVDGCLRAYTINELQHNGYATNLLEHADTQYTGIFRILKQFTCAELRDRGYRYWNHQQDGGVPGLRKSKESFHPVFYLKKYQISIT